jgi:hypothetical protein
MRFLSKAFQNHVILLFMLVSMLVGSSTVISVAAQPLHPPPHLVLSPPTSSNLLGETHTVTATITEGYVAGVVAPVSGQTVQFLIVSGPNQGLSGQGVTDSNGQTTFSWTSAVSGTDFITAGVNIGGSGFIINTDAPAEKNWYETLPVQVVPEVPFGAISALAAMAVVFWFFFQNKTRKLKKI